MLVAAIKAARHAGQPSRLLQRAGLVAALVIGDAVALCAAAGTAYWFRFGGGNGATVFRAVQPSPGLYIAVSGLLIATWLILLAAWGAYRYRYLLGGTREYALVFNAVTTGLVVTTFVLFLSPELILSRGWLLLTCVLAFTAVSGWRFTLRRAVYGLRRRGWFLSPAVIVGTNDEAAALAAQLGNRHFSGLDILGCIATESEAQGRVHAGVFVIGGLADLPDLAKQFEVEEIVVATSGLDRDALVELFRRFDQRSGPRLRLSGGLFEILTTRLEVRQLAFVSLLDVVPVRLRGVDVVLKAALDYGLACVGVLLAWPVMLCVAAVVRLDSPGPIIHRRRVLGLGGREFDALKFRTMFQDCDAILGRKPEVAQRLAEEHKVKDDPRVTRLGRWLRKTSLDELPQLFNVLRGEMSIVGPRMISPEEHRKYGQWDMNLLTVKPGITGLWQVSGRSDLSYEDRVRLDMNYIRNWTIWMDLQILMQTVPAVLLRRGAY